MYILPQAPFWPRNVQQNMENMKISKQKLKKTTHLKGHIFSAAGAFFAKKCSNNREKYENINKIMKNPIIGPSKIKKSKKYAEIGAKLGTVRPHGETVW